MDELTNILKKLTEASKLVLINFEKDLIDEFAPTLDFARIEISENTFQKIKNSMANSGRLLIHNTKENTLLYSLDSIIICADNQFLSKIEFKITNTKQQNIIISFSTKSLPQLHSYYTKFRYKPTNIELDSYSKKRFYVNIANNMVTFSNDSIAQAEEIKSLREKIIDENNSKLRVLADFQNYKKRSEQALRDSEETANKNIIYNIMEVIDDIRRATKIEETEGLNLLLTKLQNILLDQNLQEIDIKVGDKFDPLIMEALSSIPVSGGQKPNSVVHIEQTGYKTKTNGSVYRSARVIVSK